MKKEKFVIKNTLGMFDLLKGAVLLSMIIGHTRGLTDNYDSSAFSYFWAVIGTFVGEAAMPALLVVSGYGFRKTDFKMCFNRLYKTIIIPFLVTIVITCTLHLGVHYFLYRSVKESIKATGLYFLGALFGVTKPIFIGKYMLSPCGPCWFLVALVIGSLIFNQLLHYLSGKKLLIATSVIACIGWSMMFAPGLPFALSQSCITVLYLCIGYLTKKGKFFTSITTRKKGILVSLVALFAYFLFKGLGGVYNMAYLMYSVGPLCIFTYGVVSLGVIYWSLLLNRHEGPVANWFRSIGRNSLYVLCAHSIELQAFGLYFQEWFVEKYWQGPVWQRNLILIITRVIIDLAMVYGFLWFKGRFFKKDNE